MKKTISLGIILLTSRIAYAQVGINTVDPKVTFEVMPTNTGATTAEGILLQD